MSKLWSIVLEASIHASIVGIVILLVKCILRDKISGKWSYLLWMLLVIKLIIPFGPQSSLSVFNKLPINISQINSYDESLDISKNEYTEGYDIDDMTYSSNTENNVIINEESTFTTKKEFRNSKSVVFDILPLIWLGGFITSLFVAVFMNFVLNYNLKKDNKNIDERLELLLIKCKNNMGIRTNIDISINEDIRTPGLCKIIKPKIIFPYSMIDLNDDEVEHILLHELSHYKRCDILVNYLLILLQCVHWFNPLIWYLFKKIREDMELATDEMVVKVLDESEHKNYAMTIITLIERVNIIPKNIGILGMADNKKILKKRINMIKKAKIFKNRKVLISVMGVSCMLVLGTILLTSKSDSKDDIVKGNLEGLLEYKNAYVGNASNINNLLQNLTFGWEKESIELKTDKEPYGIRVYYKLKDINKSELEYKLFVNSTIIFSLIDNLENIEYYILDKSSHKESELKYELNFNKNDVENALGIDSINKFNKSEESFNLLIEKLSIYRQVGTTLDEAISNTIKKFMYDNDFGGELDSEGYKILGSKENKNIIETYVVFNYGSFEFENDVFSILTRAYCETVAIKFKIGEDNKYYLIDYKIPLDGSYYLSSRQEIFPVYLWYKVINTEKYFNELAKQQENQAKEYLKSINREADINVDENRIDGKYSKEYPSINVEAQDKIYMVEELYTYPSWIGTREAVIDGKRYKYEMTTKKDTDGYHVMIYKKYDEYKNLIEEHNYKIYDNDIKEIKHIIK
ncbi:Regulatory protein BlaR1 [uncultured Clostridium sp.]|nr:Regulatory protein BlaR1 [uncultured Clostridium sp.]